MSLPKFPDKGQMLSREEVINQIISSIAMEELGLSHIINAEGEKLQYALGTIPGVTGPEEPLKMDDLIELNKSVHKTLDSTMMNQFFLKEKLLSALSAAVMQGPPGPTGPQGPARIHLASDVIPLGPDDLPTVKNIGPSDQEVTLQFGIPRGITGATGPQGNPGGDGADGISPHIDPDTGNWFIGTVDTDVQARGPQGMAATIDVEQPARISYDDNPHVQNVGTLQEAVLRFELPSGKSPHVDTDTGHWFVGSEDTGVQAQGPKGEPGPIAATIPFSISKYGVNLSIDAQGDPLMVAFSGFGSTEAIYLQEGEWGTGTITFDENKSSFGTSFIMPHDGTLKKIHVLFCTKWNVQFEEGSTIRPFVCLAVSISDDLVYTILQETLTFTEPYAGGVEYPMYTLRRGSLSNLNVAIPEGALVAIIVGIRGENVTYAQNGEFSISGGLYLE